MEVTIKGFITWRQYEWEDKPTYHFSMYNPQELNISDEFMVMEHSITVDVPADFDPRPAQIAALNEQKKKIREKYLEKVAEIEERISKLLAISHTPAQTNDVPF